MWSIKRTGRRCDVTGEEDANDESGMGSLGGIYLEYRPADDGVRRGGWRAENTMARIFRAYDLEVLDAHVIATQRR